MVHRQTTLFAHLLSVHLQNLRIDQDVRVRFVRRHVRNEQTPVQIDLGGRKPYPRRLIHGLEHVANYLPEGVIHNIDRRRGGSQSRIREFEYLEYCHVIFMSGLFMPG